jgi:hypothetical protein
MERMENLIRESLQARAQDVEPTPALWLEVDRRVARRRRFQVVSWSLAGAAAWWRPSSPSRPSSGCSPDRSRSRSSPGPHPRRPASSPPTSSPSTPTGSCPWWTCAAASRSASWPAGRSRGGPRGFPRLHPRRVEFIAQSATGELSIVGGGGVVWSSGEVDSPDGFAWSVVAAPDGRWFASTSPPPESRRGDGRRGSPGLLVGTRDGGAPGPRSAWVDRASRLVAWTGATADEGDRSTLWIVTADGTLVREQLEVIDGIPTSLETGTRDAEGVIDAATSFVRAAPTARPPTSCVEQGRAALELVGAGEARRPRRPGSRSGRTSVTSTPDLWLDAKQDAALVGDGERTWLLAHDGAGALRRADRARRRDRAGRLARRRTSWRADRPRGPTEGPTEQPTEPGHGRPRGPDRRGGAPAVADRDRLHARPRAARPRRSPGRSTRSPRKGSPFVSARVRPGSTMDDLTVAALAMGEGMFDLRWYRWVDGELTWDYFPEHLQGWGFAAIVTHGPVWSPDGDRWSRGSSSATVPRRLRTSAGTMGRAPGTRDRQRVVRARHPRAESR